MWQVGIGYKNVGIESMVFITDQKQPWQKSQITSLQKGVQTNIVHDHVVFNAFKLFKKWNHDVLEWLFESSIIITFIPNCYTCSIMYLKTLLCVL
jgi:hypothetical protein